MSQFFHTLIGIILFWLTFQFFLKRLPLMQEELARYEKIFDKWFSR